ncbi:MAG: SAF domain-containing protein [Mycobacteriales bacterium]
MPVRRRRPLLAAVAVMLVVGCAAVSASLVLASEDSLSVLTVTRPVPAGQVLTAADLGTATISGSGLTALDASSRDEVVGLTAAVDLLPGTLLSDAMVTPDPVPGPGQAVVGLSLKPGLLPDAELRAGSFVMVVRLAAPTGSPGTAARDQAGDQILVPRARVLSETSDPTTGGRLVSLVLERSAAADVTRAAAAGTVSLVVIGPGA